MSTGRKIGLAIILIAFVAAKVFVFLRPASKLCYILGASLLIFSVSAEAK